MTDQPQDAARERRQFSRIRFEADVHLSGPGARFRTHLLDISLKGALLARPQGCPASEGPWTVDVTLSDRATHICMRAILVHAEPDRLGFRCDHIDLDSIVHLRRLVELNLGDPALLERELAALL